MSAPPIPPPPPPPPGKDWKPNWREQRAKEDAEGSSTPVAPTGGPASPATGGNRTPGEVGQFDKLPGALLKTALGPEKKPFTYTPAGLDLSEIKSPHMQRRMHRAREANAGDRPSSPLLGSSPQSASSFLDEFGPSEYGRQYTAGTGPPPPLPPRGASKTPMSPLARPNDTARYGAYLDDIPDITEYCNDPSRLDDAMVNPRYRGSNIPSRSFKVLEKLTAGEMEDEPEPPRQFKARIQPPRAYASNKEPARNYQMPPPPEPPRNKPATPPVQQPYVFPGQQNQQQPYQQDQFYQQSSQPLYQSSQPSYQQQQQRAAQNFNNSNQYGGNSNSNNWYKGPSSPQSYPQSAPAYPNYNAQQQTQQPQQNYTYTKTQQSYNYGTKAAGPLSPRMYTPPVKPDYNAPKKPASDPFEDFWPSFNALAQPAYEAYETLKKRQPSTTNTSSSMVSNSRTSNQSSYGTQSPYGAQNQGIIQKPRVQAPATYGTQPQGYSYQSYTKTMTTTNRIYGDGMDGTDF